MDRPKLDINISPDDFKNYYWLKEELVVFCRQNGIDHSGGKADISGRIMLFLETGIKTTKKAAKKPEKSSGFDWNTETLSPSTIITDDYKNTQNVRGFFAKEIGKQFSFNVQFMDWMKENTGKTLADAVNEWKKIHAQKKDKNYKTNIAPQFEYNKYIRAFMTDNPDKTLKDAINCWKKKRSRKGTNEYEKSDLE
ncbi:hypothetical protein D0T49_10740 [Paludibacter sp. 221]|uniref:DUF6434 domain-containing protein n=1 Tax=Paludibacter sp. 221 TaxID=2302939 RepID=UPI0013D5F5FF|nr:DUF6434 domain-containing protein [Paludibacter sp. 221]NDV47523.1 hypothetical protein [Paludibacter sp. 221]